jgi:hypothetical protein
MRKELTIDEPIQRNGAPLAAKEAIFTNAPIAHRQFRAQEYSPSRRPEKGSAMIEMQMENERVESGAFNSSAKTGSRPSPQAH